MNTDNRPPPYSMRLDPDLRTKLEAIAKANGRSLHAEISMRLEASLQPEENTSPSSSKNSEQDFENLRLELERNKINMEREMQALKKLIMDEITKANELKKKN